MNENEYLIDKFRDIFFIEGHTFEIDKYAFDLFFKSDSHRFDRIALNYKKFFGYGAYSYMIKTKSSWENNTVHPNYSSRYNIIASVTSTFSYEEKFILVYAEIIKQIRQILPKIITLKEVGNLFEKMLSNIQTFDLRKITLFRHKAFDEKELDYYQDFFKHLFSIYIKKIYINLLHDIELFQKLYTDLNTHFLDTTFHIFLFNIKVNISKSNCFREKNINNNVIDYEITTIKNNPLYNFNFSIQEITKILKSPKNNSNWAQLSFLEITKINDDWKTFLSSNLKWSLHKYYYTKSGKILIDLKILSGREKLLVYLRLLLFLSSLIILSKKFIFEKESYLLFSLSIAASSILVIPIQAKIYKLIGDLLNSLKVTNNY
jgi:hypothetical protein